MLAEPSFHTRAFVEWEAYPRSVLIAAQRAGYFAPAPIWDDLRHRARPVMRATTSLHRHKAGGMSRHELVKLNPRQLLAEHDRPISRCAMEMENVLCQIDANDGNFAHRCLIRLAWFQRPKPGTLRRRRGGRHPPHHPSWKPPYSRSFDCWLDCRHNPSCQRFAIRRHAAGQSSGKLLEAGHVQAIHSDDHRYARVTFAAFQMAYRTDPMTAMIARAAGLSEEDIDAIWTGFASV
jgi:hypothetical protein